MITKINQTVESQETEEEKNQWECENCGANQETTLASLYYFEGQYPIEITEWDVSGNHPTTVFCDVDCYHSYKKSYGAFQGVHLGYDADGNKVELEYRE